jgi:hypothetical protein
MVYFKMSIIGGFTVFPRNSVNIVLLTNAVLMFPYILNLGIFNARNFKALDFLTVRLLRHTGIYTIQYSCLGTKHYQ